MFFISIDILMINAWEWLKNNFYLDNLIISNDDNSKLMYIYQMAITR